MGTAELIALAALVVSVVTLVLTEVRIVRSFGRDDGTQDGRIRLLERRLELADELYKAEIKNLREWRHKVGEAPGLAALTKAEEIDRRVTRLENVK